MSHNKRKRDLFSTLNHIERYYRRRMSFSIHLVVSLGIQFALWANWYASYAAQGRGFESTFFADRLILSVVASLMLLGHWSMMRLTDRRDRAVVQAILAHEAELEDEEPTFSRLVDDLNAAGTDEAATLDERRQSSYSQG